VLARNQYQWRIAMQRRISQSFLFDRPTAKQNQPFMQNSAEKTSNPMKNNVSYCLR